MKKHTKIYLNWCESINIYPEDINCEVCGKNAGSSFIMDIHHIKNRGAGGSKTKDNIKNLMAVCRTCHKEYGDKKQYKEWLEHIHEMFMFNKIK